MRNDHLMAHATQEARDWPNKKLGWVGWAILFVPKQAQLEPRQMHMKITLQRFYAKPKQARPQSVLA